MKTTERLECKVGGSNKYYEFIRDYNTPRFTVTGFFGAIGQAPKSNVLYDGDSEEDAEKQYKKKRAEKMKKQYLPVASNGTVIAPAVIVPVAYNDVPVIWAMNAQGTKKNDDFKHLNSLLEDNNYIAQEKLDGMRTVVHITAEGLRIFSRNAGVDDPTRPLEKTQSLPHLAALKFPGLEGTVFDSEILVEGKDSANIAGAVNRHAAVEGDTLAKLYIFDLLSLNGDKITNCSLSGRLVELSKIASQLEGEYTKIVPYVTGTVAKRQLLDDAMSTGREGIMLKNLNAVYEEGGRPSKNWYKAKKSIKVDCVGMGFTKGQGKYNNQIGAFIFGQYIGGVLTEIGQTSGMTDAIRRDMTDNPDKYIGHAVVIKGMERLKSNAIRHPQFDKMHDDKLPEDCIMYDNEQ
jgi:ATP-dependent DNA ligase